MSGSKKNKAGSATPDPPALPGPTLNVPPAPTNVPGHLELLSQQINQGYPSLGQADLLKQMQNTYRPAPGPDPATAAGVAQAKAGTGSAFQSGGSRNIGRTSANRGMIQTPGELAQLIMNESRRRRGL